MFGKGLCILPLPFQLSKAVKLALVAFLTIYILVRAKAEVFSRYHRPVPTEAKIDTKKTERGTLLSNDSSIVTTTTPIGWPSEVQIKTLFSDEDIMKNSIVSMILFSHCFTQLSATMYAVRYLWYRLFWKVISKHVDSIIAILTDRQKKRNSKRKCSYKQFCDLCI